MPHVPDQEPDVLVQYLSAVRAAIDAIESTQLAAIREAAQRFATAILKDRLVHVFGTGHSRMAVEEMFPRYGSFPGFHPIVELSMTFHNPVVGANGQRQAMFLENVQGFGAVLWRNFATSPDDALLAISTSGCNAVTIDVALEAKRQRMFVVALTALKHAAVSASRHESGKKLHEIADLVLDQQRPGWRFGRLGRWSRNAGGAAVQRHRLRDRQPRQGGSCALAHRGWLAAQGADRGLPSRSQAIARAVRRNVRRLQAPRRRTLSLRHEHLYIRVHGVEPVARPSLCGPGSRSSNCSG